MTFAHGTSNELSIDQLLFDVHRADFRKENRDIGVPVIPDEPKLEADTDKTLVDPDLQPQHPHVSDPEQRKEEKSLQQARKPDAPKDFSWLKEKAPAKGGASKGGVASKGKAPIVKKKR